MMIVSGPNSSNTGSLCSSSDGEQLEDTVGSGGDEEHHVSSCCGSSKDSSSSSTRMDASKDTVAVLKYFFDG